MQLPPTKAVLFNIILAHSGARSKCITIFLRAHPETKKKLYMNFFGAQNGLILTRDLI